MLVLLVLGGYFITTSEQAAQEVKEKEDAGEEVRPVGLARFPFQLGLDLQGGAQLIYEADMTGITDPQEQRRRMNSLRSLIEQRVDGMGVSEPLVQVERGGLAGGGEHRLIVELPGVTDLEEAVETIGKTPLLEFALIDQDQAEEITPENELEVNDEESVDIEEKAEEPEEETEEGVMDDIFQRTELDGSMVAGARYEMNPTTREHMVIVEFDREGTRIFREITQQHQGEPLAILLDGVPISQPVIREVIRGGEATISGGFTMQQARDLAEDLEMGALPVNIELMSTETIGPTLGQDVLEGGVLAGVVGLMLVAVFLLLWYRLPGLLAIAALGLYLVIMLSLFKLLPVTLTAAGIAGFILSIGMAVDANVLIYERMKEELRNGKPLREAIADGFSRAWLSIRDGNVSSMITAIILYWFGTSLVQGFALVFFVGILVSMLTAISVTRTFLLACTAEHEARVLRVLFNSGLSKAAPIKDN